MWGAIRNRIVQVLIKDLFKDNPGLASKKTETPDVLRDLYPMLRSCFRIVKYNICARKLLKSYGLIQFGIWKDYRSASEELKHVVTVSSSLEIQKRNDTAQLMNKLFSPLETFTIQNQEKILRIYKSLIIFFCENWNFKIFFILIISHRYTRNYVAKKCSGKHFKNNKTRLKDFHIFLKLKCLL